MVRIGMITVFALITVFGPITVFGVITAFVPIAAGMPPTGRPVRSGSGRPAAEPLIGNGAGIDSGLGSDLFARRSARHSS